MTHVELYDPRTALDGGSPIIIPFDALDPLTARLGLVAGLLLETDSGYEVETSWFQDPLAGVRAIPNSPEQTQQLLALLEELFGSITGNSLGIPNQEEGRRWYPINNPFRQDAEEGNTSTGLYLITEEQVREDTTYTVIGLGSRHQFVVEGVVIAPYIYVPLLVMPALGGNTFILGSAEFPIELGIQITMVDGTFGSELVSFDGIQVAATVQFSNAPFSLDVLLLNLKLPGRPAQDTSVGALLDIPTDEWVSIATYLLVSQLIERAPNSQMFKDMADSLMGMLGLIGDVPPVDWDALRQNASQAPQIFSQWLRSVASDTQTFRTWLNDWYCLFNGKSPLEGNHITGEGTRVSPFAIEVLSLADNGLGVDFTFALTIEEETENLRVFPGVRVTPKVFHPLDEKPEVEVRMTAAAELMMLNLPKNLAPSVSDPFPSFSAMAVLANPTKAFSSEEGENALITIGTIEAGFTYRRPIADGTPAEDQESGIYPTFLATMINTPYGAWDSIDFTNFEEVINTAGEVLVNLVQQKMDEFFSATGDSTAAKMSKAFAASIGLFPPQGYTTENWPVKELLLSGPGGIESLIVNPFGTLGSYYTRCLSTEENGTTAWQSLFPQFAVVLGDTSAQDRQATGSGTEQDPWEIQMFTSDPTQPALYLQSWLNAAGSEEHPLLVMALAFKVPLEVSSVALGFSLKAEVLRIPLPDVSGQGAENVTWLTGADARFSVTGPDGTPLQSPDLGGVSVSTDGLSAVLGWNRVPPPAELPTFPDSPFYGHAALEQVKMYANGTLLDEIGDIKFDFFSTRWTDEVLGQLTKAAFDAAGVWLLSHGGGFGVTLTAGFGLLPNLAGVFDNKPEGGYPFPLPDGLTLPDPWPRMVILNEPGGAFFANPWLALRNQLDVLLQSGDYAIPLMQLLGWSIDDSLPAAPDPTPAGTLDDPFWVELTGFWQLRPLFWTATETEAKRLGFGVARVMLSESAEELGVRMVVTARVDIGEVDVATGAYVDQDGETSFPRGSLIAVIDNPSGEPLINTDIVEIGSAEIGFTVDRSGIAPIVTLYQCRIGEGELQDYDLTEALSGTDAQQILESLLYALMNKLTAVIGEIEAMQPFMNVLADLELVIPPGENDGLSYAVNLGSWQAMASDPIKFFTDSMFLLLQDAERLESFYQSLAELIGFESFQLPESLQGLPDLLVALGLMEQQPGGYALVLSQWVALVRNPVGFLKDAGRSLLDPEDTTLRKALVAALSDLPTPPPPLSDAPLTIEDNTLITLRIPADKLIDIGAYLDLDARLVLNLQNLTLSTLITVTSIQAGMALNFSNVFSFAGSEATWELSLSGAGANDVPAPFEPIVFYPLPDETAVTDYLLQLGVQIPVLLASSFGTQMINAYLIGEGDEPIYPVIYRVLKDLGLTQPSDNSPLERVQSLVGLFMNPVDWVLSEPALGNGSGGFDLDKVGSLMFALPGPEGIQGPGTIRLDQDVDGHGMIVSGLPFGAKVQFSSTAADGIGIGLDASYAFDINAAGGITPEIALAGKLFFGKGSGVRVTGSVVPSFIFDSEGPTSLSIETLFDDQFYLNLWGELGGARFPSDPERKIVLVPFGGLSQFQEGVQALLIYAGNQLVALYNQYADAHPQSRIVQLVNNITQVLAYFGITDVATLFSTFEEVSADPMAWLLSFFQEEKLPQTLSQINTLMDPDHLNLPGFSMESEKVLAYVPPGFPTENVTLTITLGEQDGVFGVRVRPTLSRDWALLTADVGIGFQTPLQVGAPVRFDMNVGAGIDAEQLPSQLPGAPILVFGLQAGGGLDYFLRFYPLGQGQDKDDLLAALLPSPFLAYGDAPTVPVPISEWLLSFTTNFLVPFLADTLLQTEQVSKWLNQPLLSGQPDSPPPGPMLVDWSLLTQTGETPDATFSLQNIADMFTDSEGNRLSPTQIIEKLFLSVLKALSGFRVVPIGENGGIYIQAREVGDQSDYGLRVQIPDIQVIGSPENGNVSEGSVTLTIQLGQFLSINEGKDTNWIDASDPSANIKDPGVVFYLVRAENQGDANPQFHPALQLNSIGVDMARGNGLPLVDVRGFLMGFIEPRVYLDLDFGALSDTSVGAAIQVGGIGVPLGTDTIEGFDNVNPVAQNLLVSGKSDGTGGPVNDGETTDAVNPTFSVATGYVYNPDPDAHTSLYLRLSNDDGSVQDDNFIWIPIQRAFGPIQCRQIGLGWEGGENRLQVGFSGNVTLAGLALSLINLKVGVPVTAPTNFGDYTLDLDGINLSYKGGPVNISGGFLKTEVDVEGETVTVYSGQARIQASKWGLSALGSYALIGQNTPSVFIFALLDAPLGGYPFFFIKGVAAGFGFNRSLVTPTRAQDVFDFPFVKGVIDPTYFNGNNAEDALQKLSDVSQPKRGAYWIAAGLKFSSFEMVHSFALLTATFGTDFQLNLMGVSTIELPVSVPGGDSYTPLARAELALLVSFRPSEGVFAVEAALSKNSYVISQDARLTGGFAFYTWFQPNPNSGQFVITLGGYHPRFNPPSFYPDEPRLGFTWLMPQYNVTIQGGGYFALVPTAVMAGGYLDVQYKSGNLKAWFSAQANMLISWKPFYFDIDISISVGASYRVKLLFVSKTFSIELGASLNLWGPPTGGKVRVSWWVISFTISFGPGKESKAVLDWSQFNESFLPQPDNSGRLTAGVNAMQRDPRTEVRVSKGLVESISDEQTGVIQRWLIDPQSFEMETELQVPITAASLNGITLEEVLIPEPGTDPVVLERVPISEATLDLGIIPMRVGGLDSVLTMTIAPAGDNDMQDANDLFEITGLTNNVPKAMWNPDGFNELDADTVIPNAIIGVRITPIPYVPDTTLPVPVENMQFAAAGVSFFTWSTAQPPTEPQYPNLPEITPTEAIGEEMASLQDQEVLGRRAALIEDLAEAGLPVNLHTDTSLLAHTADQVFLSAPVLVTLGGVVTQS